MVNKMTAISYNIAHTNLSMFFSIILSILLLNRGGQCHQFPELLNNDDSKDVYPFRMNKINVIWIKAKQLLSETELPRLYAELSIQDRLEIENKKKVAEGGDEDGLQEAVLRRKFYNILQQFGLENLYDLTASKRADDSKFDEILRSNDKLSKLWAKAEASTFSEKELEMLRKEFQHHLEKVREYEVLKQDLERLQAMDENTLEGPGGGRVELQEKNSELKRLYRVMMKSYQDLNEKTTFPDIAGEGLSSLEGLGEFNDPRIRELWTLALKSNLSETELTSFREELGHFQKRISKHEYFAKEAEMIRVSHDMKQKSQSGNSVSDSEPVYPSSYRELESKAQELGSKVKKWYSELKSRLLRTQQSHTEL